MKINSSLLKKIRENPRQKSFRLTRPSIVRIVNHYYKWKTTPQTNIKINEKFQKKPVVNQRPRTVVQVKKSVKRLDEKRYIIPIYYQIPIAQNLPKKQVVRIVQNSELYRFRVFKQAENLQNQSQNVLAQEIKPEKKSFQIIENTNEIKKSEILANPLQERIERKNFPESNSYEKHFYNEKNQKTKVEIYNPDGTLKSRYFYNAEGQNTKVEFYENGKLTEQQFFENGQKTKVEIYENEKLKQIKDFKNKTITVFDFKWHNKTIEQLSLAMDLEGNIDHRKLTSEQKKYFQSTRHQGLSFLTNSLENNGAPKITNSAIKTLAQDLQPVLKARNPNFEFLILEPNYNLKDIVNKNLEKNKVYLVPFVIPGHQIFALVKNNEIQILDNGGMSLREEEDLKNYFKTKNFSVTYNRIPYQQTLPLNNFGSCVTFVEALMIEVTKMATGLTYKHFVNLEAEFKTPKIDATMSLDTIANFIKDYCASKDHGKGMDIFKIVANYNLLREQKNLSLDQNQNLTVSSENKPLLMGLNTNLTDLQKIPKSTQNIIAKGLGQHQDQNQNQNQNQNQDQNQDQNNDPKSLPIHRKNSIKGS